MNHIVQVEDVTKVYYVRKRKTGFVNSLRNLFGTPEQMVGVENVTFNLEQGSVTGLIGANGAGKSTTIKMITGILNPSSGNIRVFGKDPTRERQNNAHRFGLLMGQRSQLWWDLPVYDSFELYRRMYAIKKDQFLQMLNIFDEMLEIKKFMDTPVRQLSLGQRVRCEFSVAMLHRPTLLFLDEPTIGIDILAKQRILEFIRHIAKEWGTTVLLTTHDISDIEKVVSHVLILDHGKLIFNHSLDDLMALETLKRIEVKLQTEVKAWESFEHVKTIPLDLNTAAFVFDKNKVDVPELVSKIIANYPVLDITIQPPDIESVVKHIYATGVAEQVI